MSSERDRQAAEKMGNFFQPEFLDFPCVIDLSRVVEYHGSRLLDAGQYDGANTTWVHMTPNNSTQILMPFDEFHTLFTEFEKTNTK